MWESAFPRKNLALPLSLDPLVAFGLLERCLKDGLADTVCFSFRRVVLSRRYLTTKNIVKFNVDRRACCRNDVYRFDIRSRRDSAAIFSIYYARVRATQATTYRSLICDFSIFSLFILFQLFQLLSPHRHAQDLRIRSEHSKSRSEIEGLSKENQLIACT